MCRYQQREPVHHPRAARRRVRAATSSRRPSRRATKHEAIALALAIAARARQQATASGRRLPPSRPCARATSPSWPRKIVIVTLFSSMAVRLASDWLATGHVTGMLLLASEALVVALTLVRRSAGVVDRSVQARAADGVVDVRPAAGHAACRRPRIAPETLTVADLGRRPHHRGARQAVARPQLRPDARQPRRRLDRRSTGCVRHPIYLGYLITHVGFVARQPGGLEPLVLAAADVALMLRAVREERTLAPTDHGLSRVLAVAQRVRAGGSRFTRSPRSKCPGGSALRLQSAIPRPTVAPRWDSGRVVEARPADASPAPPARCRAARPCRARGSAAPRAARLVRGARRIPRPPTRMSRGWKACRSSDAFDRDAVRRPSLPAVRPSAVFLVGRGHAASRCRRAR